MIPQTSEDAELLADRISPRLQHSNSAIVLMSVRIILYLMNYISKQLVIDNLYKKLGPPLGNLRCMFNYLVTLLNCGPEIQFVALKNILLIHDANEEFLINDIRIFFCKYNDPIYVKLAKLNLLCRLVTNQSISKVLPELKEYASEVDIEFVRKTIRSIGHCAIKLEESAQECVQALIQLVQTRVSYVVQEAVIVIKVSKFIPCCHDIIGHF